MKAIVKERQKIVAKQSFSNGYATEICHKRVVRLNFALNFMIILQLSIFHCSFQLSFANNNFYQFFIYAGNALTIFQILVIILLHKAYNHLMIVYLDENRIQSTNHLFFQIFLLLISPYPFFQQITIINYDYSTLVYNSFKLNYLLIIISMVKIWFCVSFILQQSKYLSPRSVRICQIYTAYPGFIYCLRANLSQNPIRVSVSIILVSMVVFSFAFRISEASYCQSSIFGCYLNIYWLVIITMTTVGYGDETPRTAIGRLLICICISWGAFIVSVMVVVLLNVFQMDYNELRALNTLKKLHEMKELKEIASQYICQAMLMSWKRKKGRMYVEEEYRERKLKMKFKETLRKVKKPLPSRKEIQFYNEMNWHFQRSFHTYERLVANNKEMINWLHEELLEDSPTISVTNNYIHLKSRRKKGN